MTDNRRLLVVSHPAVVSVNQEPYLELSRRGWNVTVVLPNRWRHSYSDGPVEPEALDGFATALRPTPVVFAGQQQRHVYLTRAGAVCRDLEPDIAFLEAEPFSLAATQWSGALSRRGIPFGVQCDENIDRSLPAPIRSLRSRVLRKAAFVAARSDSAGEMVRHWGARGEVGLVPHPVPAWDPAPRPAKDTFTVGFAGRLIESKGLPELVDAVRLMEAPVELLLIGNGEMREQLERQSVSGSTIRVVTDISHDQMAEGYAQCDVMVLPSRTTATWKEQFGRVLVEALWCGIPVVGSDSGEIPWVIEKTEGGLVFPEGDAGALADRLNELRKDPDLRQNLAKRGRENVVRLFSMQASTDALDGLLTRGAADTQAVSSA